MKKLLLLLVPLLLGASPPRQAPPVFPRQAPPTVNVEPTATPGVVAQGYFQGSRSISPGAPYSAGHQCPACGLSAYSQSGAGPAPGSHLHTCANGHTWWHYDAPASRGSISLRRLRLR